MTVRAIPIVALDVASEREALALASRVSASCHFFKVGMELFTAAGPNVVRALRDTGADVFLDLKFHDIPNTVAGAVRSAVALGVRLLTVHACGGPEMMRAAQEAAGSGCGVLGVTVLTSHDESSLGAVLGREVSDMTGEVRRLAELARGAGLHGIVCSGLEAAAVRERHGEELALLVPGIRLEGGGTQDQRRVMTPRAAAEAGATYLILGRAVTAAADPSAAMGRVLAELRSPVP